jgi:hypothetical protein
MNCMAVLTLLATIGCTKPPAVDSNLELEGDLAGARGRLDDSRQAAVVDALRSFADGQTISGEPLETGLRWSDLELAVDLAADEQEMAVVERRREEWGTVFELISIRDEPGVLTVYRRPEPEVYQAEASVGVFGDRTSMARTLVAAVDAYMKLLGEKPAFVDDPERLGVHGPREAESGVTTKRRFR